MPASDTKLGALHEAVTDALIHLVKGTEIPIINDDGEVTGSDRIPPSAAVIQAAAKFLADNKITCIPATDNKLGELEEAMKKRAAARANLRPQAIDLDDASDNADFMRGLQ